MANASKSALTVVDLDRVLCDSRLQFRGRKLDDEVVERYRQVIKDGGKKNGIFGGAPILAVEDNTDTPACIWLVDGFHRVAALRREGFKRYEVELRPGDFDFALLLSTGANSDHGMPRDHGTVKRSILALLSHPLYSEYSVRKIAEIVRCDHSHVVRIRQEYRGNQDAMKDGDSHHSDEPPDPVPEGVGVPSETLPPIAPRHIVPTPPRPPEPLSPSVSIPANRHAITTEDGTTFRDAYGNVLPENPAEWKLDKAPLLAVGRCYQSLKDAIENLKGSEWATSADFELMERHVSEGMAHLGRIGRSHAGD